MKDNLCPYCENEVVLRVGKHGYFWGCSKFPKCNFTSDLQGENMDVFSRKIYEEEKLENELKGIYQASLNGD